MYMYDIGKGKTSIYVVNIGMCDIYCKSYNWIVFYWWWISNFTVLHYIATDPKILCENFVYNVFCVYKDFFRTSIFIYSLSHIKPIAGNIIVHWFHSNNIVLLSITYSFNLHIHTQRILLTDKLSCCPLIYKFIKTL